MRTGTLCEVIYAYGPHPEDETRYAPIAENGLYMQTLPNRMCEVFLPGGRIVRCSRTRLVARVFPDDPTYAVRFAELFPGQSAEAA